MHEHAKDGGETHCELPVMTCSEVDSWGSFDDAV